jgi:hypothetical protein
MITTTRGTVCGERVRMGAMTFPYAASAALGFAFASGLKMCTVRLIEVNSSAGGAFATAVEDVSPSLAAFPDVVLVAGSWDAMLVTLVVYDGHDGNCVSGLSNTHAPD